MLTETAPGLTSAEVAERVATGRTNAYEAPTSRSIGSILRANVLTLFNGIVAGCFLLLLLLGRWQDALFGLAAVGNALIGTVQEYRAKRSLDKLALLNAPGARVRRDGEIRDIRVGEVVLDDLLELRAGDQIPADALVANANHLQVDESMLTGESDPVDKVTGDHILSGAVVVSGEGTATVEHVGADSYANRLAGEAKRFSLVASELRSSVNRVLKWITWIIGPLALLVLNSQMVVSGGWAQAIETGSWRDAAVRTIASIIAMVPLGLVLMTSIAFAVGAVKLARHKVLVQELPAVEGLARVDIICLDKTGTLTAGDIVFDEAHVIDPQPGWEAVLGWNGAEPDANATARCMSSHFEPTEGMEPAARIPFSSARKWSAASFTEHANGTWVLGGPEMVFTPDEQPKLLKDAAALAATGKRTLVLAHAPAPIDDAQLKSEARPVGLTPVALLTFKETIRPDAHETLTYFAAQGVAVRIISGDNPQTVAAIARGVGIDVASGFDARDLPESDEEFAKVLAENMVFGRVTPQQKKRIVLSLQASGHTVAMTGDGVNDALAIKEADIGIAMESGSAATKAVARIVLLDSKFSRLPGVVDEGRQVIANIERVSMLFLTKTSYAVLLGLVFGSLLLEFPFLPRQLSVTDALTIGIPAFFLALLPNKQRYLPGFLRRSLTFAIPAGFVVMVSITTLKLLAPSMDVHELQLRTGATITLALIGISVLVALSWPFSRWKALVVAGMILGLVLVLSIPFASEFFQFGPLGPQWAVTVGIISACGAAAIAVVRIVHLRLIRPKVATTAP